MPIQISCRQIFIWLLSIFGLFFSISVNFMLFKNFGLTIKKIYLSKTKKYASLLLFAYFEFYCTSSATL
jgi:hypothetical protein